MARHAKSLHRRLGHARKIPLEKAFEAALWKSETREGRSNHAAKTHRSRKRKNREENERNHLMSWSTNYVGCRLQSTTDLASPTLGLFAIPAVVNGQYTIGIRIANPVSGSQQFFRFGALQLERPVKPYQSRSDQSAGHGTQRRSSPETAFQIALWSRKFERPKQSCLRDKKEGSIRKPALPPLAD